MNRRFLPSAALSVAALMFAPLAIGQEGDQRANSEPQGLSPQNQLDQWRADFGQEWQSRTSRHTGTLEILFGGKAEPVSRPQVSRDADWFGLTRFWVGQTFGMHGVYTQDLSDDRVVFLPLAKSNSTDKMTVAMTQSIGGVPVEDGRINALYTIQGELLSLHTTAAPSVADRSVKPRYDSERATLAAMDAFFDETGRVALDVHPAELIFAHVDDQESRRWTLAWQIDVQNNEEGQNAVGWKFTVDAQTGAVLKKDASVHYFDVTGTVSTNASPGSEADHAGNPAALEPMPYARVTSSAGTVYTDANGTFTFPGVNTPLNVTVSYFGDFADANNDAGSDYSLTFSNVQPNQSNSLVMNPNPTEFVTSQANAYTSVARLRDWIRARIPGDATADFRAVCNVNQNSSCNANFNGSATNYFRRQGSCNNTAFSAVVAHEMGHWLNVRYGTNNGSDGMGEGNADVFALYLYDDPVMGRYFRTNGGSVRNGTNTRQYCGDGNGGCHGGVHANGEVWMGAAWKIRENLNASLGAVQGDLTADLLFLGWMNAYNQREIDSIIEVQWLTLDDDNGNINDGTPNYDAIDNGFTIQGFPGYELPSVVFSNHVPVMDTRDESGPYLAQIDIEGAFGTTVNSAMTFYRVNNGPWAQVSMVQTTGDTWVGAIPGFVSPATVEYYYRATNSINETQEFPEEGALSPFEFRIGTVNVFLTNDFEGATNEGWVGGAPGDNATTGIWVRDDPIGTAAQSEDDHTPGSGTQCWFTGQGSPGGGQGQNDVDGGSTTLLSPIFDAEGLANASISYWRWYQNSTGGSPNNDIFRISLSGDGGNTWTQVEQVGPAGPQANGDWYQYTFQISNVMTPTNNMRLRFVASDLGSGSIVEAAIDDVEGISLEPSEALLGTTYCSPAALNSAGFPGTIEARGSLDVSQNEVRLEVNNLPAGQFGIFLNGQAQMAPVMPNGSSGNLCLGGNLGRYNRSGEIFTASNFGFAEMQLDLTNTPTSTGPVSIMAGQTWNFQAWYRDSALSTSNFTDAVSINF